LHLCPFLELDVLKNEKLHLVALGIGEKDRGSNLQLVNLGNLKSPRYNDA
jgi:hypothetical protein